MIDILTEAREIVATVMERRQSAGEISCAADVRAGEWDDRAEMDIAQAALRRSELRAAKWLTRDAFIREQMITEIEVMLVELDNPPLVDRIFTNGWRNGCDRDLKNLFDLCLRTHRARPEQRGKREASRG